MTDVSLSADRLVKLPEVVRRVGLGKTMLYQMIGQGRFPAQTYGKTEPVADLVPGMIAAFTESDRAFLKARVGLSR